MKKIIDFLKSEGFLCLLITFLICAFLPARTGLVSMLLLLACNVIYTKNADIYNVIGFGAGYVLSVIQHMIY